MRSIFIPLLTVIWFAFSCQSEKNVESETDTISSNESITMVESSVYELRTYYASEGKLVDLLARFRNHTIALFENHGIENIGYWVPLENDENVLIYILGYQSRSNREDSWKSFREDPNWISAKEASEVNGTLVDSVKNIFLKTTTFSPTLEITDNGPRIFELRTYYTNEGKLDDLHTRFRDHTMKIFEDHGMTNIVYFDFDDDQQGFNNTLLYLITHSNREAAERNWQGFLEDPEWKLVYEASIENGNLVDSLTSVYLNAVDFSPLK